MAITRNAQFEAKAEPKIDSASVKIMRSHDYCHFEVTLGTSAIPFDPKLALKCVDDLRKTAARLADKAVEQYKIAKREFALCENEQCAFENKVRQISRLRDIAECDQTPEQKAEIKAFDDANFESRMRRRYDYEDDWNYDDQD